jgi:hypothetical protein
MLSRRETGLLIPSISKNAGGETASGTYQSAVRRCGFHEKAWPCQEQSALLVVAQQDLMADQREAPAKLRSLLLKGCLF